MSDESQMFFLNPEQKMSRVHEFIVIEKYCFLFIANTVITVLGMGTKRTP